MPTRADELLIAVERCALPFDRALVRELAACCGWGDRSTGTPLPPSTVSHGVPWGVSLAIEPALTELRLFVEALGNTPAESWAAAARVSAFAGARGASLDRLDAITAGLGAPYRVWHAVALAPAVRWHAYVCLPPGADPRALARRAQIELPPLRPADRVTMLALDLAQDMRIKAYVLMPDASLDELAALHDRATDAHRGDAHLFGALAGDRRIWWLAALGYTGASAPATCALHLGIPRHLDEVTATARIAALLRTLALPTSAWERARTAHHFVTFQRRAGRPRVTTYFLPEVAR